MKNPIQYLEGRLNEIKAEQNRIAKMPYNYKGRDYRRKNNEFLKGAKKDLFKLKKKRDQYESAIKYLKELNNE